MALARFDWIYEHLTFASIGNIESRVIGAPEPVNLMVRRGVVGGNAPKPVVTEHHWDASYLLILHSDGVKSSWRWDDFVMLANKPANAIAQALLQALNRDDDDATVVVVRNSLS